MRTPLGHMGNRLFVQDIWDMALADMELGSHSRYFTQHNMGPGLFNGILNKSPEFFAEILFGLKQRIFSIKVN